VHSRRSEEIHRSAIAFIRGACGAVSTTPTPIEASTASKAAVNLASRSRNQVGEPVSGLFKICSESARQLGCPGSGRVIGDAEQVDSAGTVLEQVPGGEGDRGGARVDPVVAG
jgi:hypothetical protein